MGIEIWFKIKKRRRYLCLFGGFLDIEFSCVDRLDICYLYPLGLDLWHCCGGLYCLEVNGHIRVLVYVQCVHALIRRKLRDVYDLAWVRECYGAFNKKFLHDMRLASQRTPSIGLIDLNQTIAVPGKPATCDFSNRVVAVILETHRLLQ